VVLPCSVLLLVTNSTISGHKPAQDEEENKENPMMGLLRPRLSRTTTTMTKLAVTMLIIMMLILVLTTRRTMSS